MNGSTLRCFATCVGILASAGSALAQPCVRWVDRTAAPPERSFHAMAYDSARGRVVLFGGIVASWVNDTWEWDGVSGYGRASFHFHV